MVDMQFKGFYIKKVEYTFIDKQSTKANIGYEIEKNSDFSYELYLQVDYVDNDRDDGKTMKLSVQISGLFNFVFDDKENLSYEEKENMLKINGAAILFPYIRTFITMMTSYDSSNEVIMIPTLNIGKIIEDIDKSK